MAILKLSIKSHVKIDTLLYRFLKLHNLLTEFSNLIINLPYKELYSFNEVILDSSTPYKWINVYNDFNQYKEEMNKPKICTMYEELTSL